MRAAIYTRISLDKTGEGAGVERQREDCLALCAERGWDAVEYSDNDTSATKGVRENYQRMLADIRSGLIDAVVVWHLDRLHRQPIELEQFIALADEKKLALATVTGEVDLSNDDGVFYARMMGIVAAKEVSRKAARQKRALKQRAQQGKGWGTRAFGYTDDDHLEQTEAQAVREAFTSVIHGGSLGSIATRWNEAGLLTAKGGNEWKGSSVRRVLLNPRYAGIREYEGQHYPAVWPAIVTEDVWKAVVGILTNPSRRVNNSRVRVHLLTALAVCGLCKGRMGVGTSGEKKRIRIVYSCKNSGCFGIQRDLHKVDGLVHDAIVGRLMMEDAEELLYDQQCVDLDSLRLESEALHGRKRSIASLIAKGSMTEADADDALSEIGKRLNEIESQMMDANAVSVFDGLIGVEDVRKAWMDKPLASKRTVIDRLAVITINPAPRGRGWHPECVDIAWRDAH